MYGGQIGQIRGMQGRAEETIAPLIEAVKANPGIVSARLGLAMLLTQAERNDEAFAVLKPEFESQFDTLRRDLTWSGGMHMCAEAVAALGAAEPAAILYERMVAYADLVPCNSVVVFEVLHWGLGRLASVLERFDEAEGHFAKAEEVHGRLKAKYFLARTHCAWAELLVVRGRPDDRLRAGTLAERAQVAAALGGYARVERQAGLLLEHLH
jgi:tetratricopeptide (TPR) repeat protein